MIAVHCILAVLVLAVAVYLAMMGTSMLKVLPLMADGQLVALIMGCIFLSLAGSMTILVVRFLWTVTV